EPQNSCFVKQPLSGRDAKTLPLRERPLRGTRINFICPITHANNPRLSARTGPRVRRSIGIQQHHALPASRQVPSAPGAKHTRPNYCRVIRFQSTHRRSILSYLLLVAQEGCAPNNPSHGNLLHERNRPKCPSQKPFPPLENQIQARKRR